jgi:hypothetical protein
MRKMNNKAQIKPIAKAVSFEEAEEIDIAYYAQVDWEESVKTVETMRKSIWVEEYKKGRIAVGKIRHLKDEEDEFE